MVNNFAFSLDWVLWQSIIFNVSAYQITVMIECITMNWDQCRDIKYDTLPQNSIQWKCEIIDHLHDVSKLLNNKICLKYNNQSFLFTSLLANKTQIYYHIVPQTLILIYTISFFYRIYCFSLITCNYWLRLFTVTYIYNNNLLNYKTE
jgi:hypothetical protein